MKFIKMYYKCLALVSFFLGFSVVLDIFVFGARLKDMMVSANSSSMSPYNTDGVANIIIVLVLCLCIPAVIHGFLWLMDWIKEGDEPE